MICEEPHTVLNAGLNGEEQAEPIPQAPTF